MPRQKSEQMTPLELEIMQVLWETGPATVQQVQKELKRELAYTTVQTVVYRLERKKALRCVKRISNANIFEAVVSRSDAERRLVDELLALFGGRAKMVMAHLVDSGELTLEDVKEAEKAIRKASGKAGTQ